MPVYEFQCDNENCKRYGVVVEELFSSITSGQNEENWPICEVCLVKMIKVVSSGTDWHFSGTVRSYKPRTASNPKSYVHPGVRRK